MHLEKSEEYMPNLILAVGLQETSSCFVYFYFSFFIIALIIRKIKLNFQNKIENKLQVHF